MSNVAISSMETDILIQKEVEQVDNYGYEGNYFRVETENPNLPSGANGRAILTYGNLDGKICKWQVWDGNSAFSNSGLMLSNQVNDYIQVEFYGTGINCLAYKTGDSGYAGFTLDGGVESSVNLFGSPAVSQSVVYSVSNLTHGKHTLKVRVTGNSQSGYITCYIDAFDIFTTTSKVIDNSNNLKQENMTVTIKPQEKQYGYNFMGKTSGSTTVNKNVFKYTSNTNQLLPPSGYVTEHSSTGYSWACFPDGNLTTRYSTVNGEYSGQLFTYDLSNLGTNDIVKNYIREINFKWKGYSESITNLVKDFYTNFYIWNNTTSIYDSIASVGGSNVTFSRNSTRYGTYGALTAQNQPAYEEMTNGTLLLEGTTNLLTANIASVETDLTGFNQNYASISRTTNESYNGTASLKVITNGTNSNEGFYVDALVTPNTTYTISVYLKGSGHVYLFLNEYDTLGGFIGVTVSPLINLSSTWTRYSVTRSFGSSGYHAVASIYTETTPAAITFYADAFQLEAKSYVTPFVIGTRNDIYEIVGLDKGTIYEGTVNLLTANQADVETDVTGFAVRGSSTLTRDSEECYNGSYSLKTVTGGIATLEGFDTTVTIVPSSNSYTASLWAKGSGSVTLYLVEQTLANAFVGQTTVAINLTSTWTRYSVTRAFGSTGEKAVIRLATSSTQATTFYADALQLEQKDHVTPFVVGSRAPYTIEGTTNLLINPKMDSTSGWTTTNGGTLALVTTSPGGSFPVSANACLSGTVIAGQVSCYITQNVSLLATTYSASAWIYIPSNVPADKACLSIMDTNFVTINSVNVTERNQWVRKSLTFTVATAGTYKLAIGLSGAGVEYTSYACLTQLEQKDHVTEFVIGTRQEQFINPYEGKSSPYGKCVWVEEATTTQPSNAFFTNGVADWNLSASNGAVVTKESVNGGLFGDKICKLTLTAQGVYAYNSQFYKTIGTITNGQKVACQIRMKASVPCDVLVSLIQSDSPWASIGSKYCNVSTKYQTFQFICTATSDMVGRYQMDVGLLPIGTVLEIDFMVAEVGKAYSTTPYDGTRAVETLTVPTFGMSVIQGTVEFIAEINDNTKRSISSQWPTLFAFQRANAVDWGIYIYHYNSKFYLNSTNDSGTAQASYFSSSLLSNGFYYVKVYWNSSILKGEFWNLTTKTKMAEMSISNPIICSGFNGFYIGSWNGNSSYFANTRFGKYKISKVAITTDPDFTNLMPLDGNTVGLYNFNGSMYNAVLDSVDYTRNYDLKKYIDNNNKINIMAVTRYPADGTYKSEINTETVSLNVKHCYTKLTGLEEQNTRINVPSGITPNAAYFNRTSTRIGVNGNTVASGVPDYSSPAIQGFEDTIELEGTTNMLSEAVATCETITEFTNVGTAMATLSTEWKKHGTYSVKIIKANSSSNRIEHRFTATPNFTIGTTYTYSFWAYNPNGISITVSGYNYLLGSVTIPPYSEKRVWCIGIPAVQWTTVCEYIYSSTNDPFYVDCFQIEAKPYATEWTLPSVVRATTYKPSQYGKMITVEEGTTNLLTENQASIETNTTGFSVTGTGTTIVKDTTEYCAGVASLKTITNGGVTIAGFSTSLTSVSANTTYTASVWIKGSGTVNLVIAEYNASDVYVGQTVSSLITLTPKWTRYSVTRAFGSTGVKALLGVYTNVTQAITFYADCLQLEQKAYATTWTLPSVVRAAEMLTLPTTGLSPKQGTIEGIFEVNDKCKIPGLYTVIFNLPRINNQNGITFRHNSSGSSWSLASYNDIGTSTTATANDSLTANDIYYYKARWDATNVILEMWNIQTSSKVLTATRSNPSLPSGFGTNIFIGNWDGMQNPSNTRYGKHKISNIAITADPDFTNLMPVDENTLWVSDFNNTLNSQTMYYTKPQVNVSSGVTLQYGDTVTIDYTSVAKNGTEIASTFNAPMVLEENATSEFKLNVDPTTTASVNCEFNYVKPDGSEVVQAFVENFEVTTTNSYNVKRRSNHVEPDQFLLQERNSTVSMQTLWTNSDLFTGDDATYHITYKTDPAVADIEQATFHLCGVKLNSVKLSQKDNALVGENIEGMVKKIIKE